MICVNNMCEQNKLKLKQQDKIILLSFKECSYSLYVCYVTQYWKTELNRTSGKIKLTPLADCHTIARLVLNLKFSQLEADYNRGGFTVMCKTRMALSSNGGYLGWQYPVLLFISVFQTFTVLILPISAINLLSIRPLRVLHSIH